MNAMLRARLAAPTLTLLTALVLAACSQPAAPAAGDSAKADPSATKADGAATPTGTAPTGATPSPTDGPSAGTLAKPGEAGPGGDVATGEPPEATPPEGEETPTAGDAKPTADTKPAADASKPDPKQPDPKADTKADTEQDDGAGAPVGVDGKEIYLAKCKSCHGVDGKGDTSVGKKIRDAGGDFPSLAGTKLAKAKIVEIVEDGVPDTKMKPYKEKLSAEQIDAVAGYVKKL